jgi:hypothetical protein
VKKQLFFLGVGLLLCVSLPAQFRDDFNGPVVQTDPDGARGWLTLTGDGEAVMDFRQGGTGYASIFVDARQDRRNVWWALIERRALEHVDLRRLEEQGRAVRIEARIRVSQAPRRVNLQLLTQRTTDYESDLMEFDIPDTTNWHTISLTLPRLDAGPDDVVSAHLALMDWGLEKYRVDVDYVKVDLVEVSSAQPDQGDAVPYHPPLAEVKSFVRQARAAQAATIDLENRETNLSDWIAASEASQPSLLAVGGSQIVILRWDLVSCRGKKAAGAGLLELTTHALERKAASPKDFGLIRVVEIMGGDPAWEQKNVAAASFCRGGALSRVLNPQMIIDLPVRESPGGKNYFTISRPVLQRLFDGRTLGIALLPLGAIHASFFASEGESAGNAPRLLFNVAE